MRLDGLFQRNFKIAFNFLNNYDFSFGCQSIHVKDIRNVEDILALK